MATVTRNEGRRRRHLRVRKRTFGTPERPRLVVYRSLKHIYAQVINDIEGNTIVSASTLDPELRGKVQVSGNSEAAKEVGKLLGQRAKAAGIEKVVFDRGGNLYHGRVAALADGAREAGLDF